jgi:drug/metabolite transporter (DMT)-like permease
MGKRPFADVPTAIIQADGKTKNMWYPMMVRAWMGTIAFTTTSIGLMTLPLSVFNILFNCSPFFTAILCHFYLKEKMNSV